MKRLSPSPSRLFRFCRTAAACASVASPVWSAPANAITPDLPAEILPLTSVRLLDGGPFPAAVKANLEYLLALDPDRLLAPFRREAGLPAEAEPYGNWESSGLDGHTAGHYLSALAHMIAAGDDTPDGQLSQRLDHLLAELQVCQKAAGNGYLGGVPGSHELWSAVAAGQPDAVKTRWAPWYNLHKTFAGLRDVWLQTGKPTARDLFIRFGDWCVDLTSHLSDDQMQEMLKEEYGGMNEVMADLYAIIGETKYLTTAKRFNQHAVLDPLIQQRDELTGLHANTQIPKVIGLARLAMLTGDKSAAAGARFFWQTVTQNRSVAFGGNSVSEHFNDPHDFHSMLVHREGPETCNTYNMLRLTEDLFSTAPNAAYADYYERALYNHILASIDPTNPGYVYFTPIRPDHYRVYSVPGEGFWCCVGTGMENPGKYGEFIYARAPDGFYVNLFIASELKDDTRGLTLRQETSFPDEERSGLTLQLTQPQTFTLHIRQPGWVAPGAFALTVNGEPVPITTAPSSYVAIRREWHDGDRVAITLPMHTTVEGLPDGSPWWAILHGPIVLAHPAGTADLIGLRADDARMAHVAAGPEVPLDQVPVLLADAKSIPSHVVADPAAGPLHFRLTDVVEPAAPQGLALIPFFRLHDARYQMYWEATSRQGLAERQEQLAAAERARAARDAATLDQVAPGEQQPEVEHAFKGQDTQSGLYNGRHWRHGRDFQYTLNARAATAVELSVTYSGSDRGRQFDILANGTLIATQDLVGESFGNFIEKRYPIPPAVLAAAPDGQLTIRFVAKKILAGGVFDVRLLRVDASADATPTTATEIKPAPASRQPGQNPLFTDTFTADPAVLVVGDTLYCYVGRDNAAIDQFFTMPEWRCYSTSDLQHWTSHGAILRSDDFAYGRPNSAWAAQMIEHDGKYFFYVTLTRNDSDEHCLAVAVGDSPLGPFKDARGTPLITDGMTTDSRRPNADIDPTVFTDGDGTSWLAWGNGDCYLAKLKPNLIELDGPIRKLDITPYYSEGPWIYRRNGQYYNIFAVDIPGTQPEQIGYATAPAITGPWSYRGLITGPAQVGFTIHPAVVDFKGQSYFFYHDGSTSLNGLPGGDCRRSVCVEYLHYNADGSIQPITQTAAGVSIPPHS